MEDSPITIGRKDCLVNLNSSIFSKNQCTIFWDNNKWFVSDGFIDKLSTNGTWFDLI
jgi:pSer/pThr/pTyr-binding forkhead associated (FHA) protein